MINSKVDIQKLLQGTFLEDADIISLEIPLSNNIAFAIAVNPQNAIESWKLFKKQLTKTQRYPILTVCWGNTLGNWQETIINEDLFSRFYFTEEYPNLDVSPEAIIARTNLFNQVNLSEFLKVSAQIHTYNLEEQIVSEIENTKIRFDSTPSVTEIKQKIELGQISTVVDLENYLFNWELNYSNKGELFDYLDYLDWYEPISETMALILLPTPNSWETLAYLSWYGGSKMAIPLLRCWNQQYQTELVCHYGTMLQFFVGKKPTTPQEAFDLAWQQIALAPCTTMLPGISIRDHARSLLAVDQWFIHERP